MQASVKLTPKAARVVPTAMLQTLGNRILKTVMNVALAPYMEQLEADYQRWAAQQPRAQLAAPPE